MCTRMNACLDVGASCLKLGHLGLTPLGRLGHQKGSLGSQFGALALARRNELDNYRRQLRW